MQTHYVGTGNDSRYNRFLGQNHKQHTGFLRLESRSRVFLRPHLETP
jgi:hypothetical protein